MAVGRLPGRDDEFLARWCDLDDRFADVFNLLLGLDYATFMFDEQRFLAVTQAAEIFHRIAIGGVPTPKDEHRARVDAVLRAGIPDEHVDWVRQTLIAANQLRLRDRLSDLVVDWDALKGVDRNWFVPALVDTRNFLTHRDRDRKSSVLESPLRYYAGQLLAWSVRHRLLIKLGVPEEEATNRVARHPAFTYALGQVTAHQQA